MPIESLRSSQVPPASAPTMFPAVDFIAVRDEVKRLASLLRDAFDDAADADETPPDVLVEALTDAIDAVRRQSQEGQGGTDPGVNRHLARLCDHGIDLLSRLSAQASRLGRGDLAADWEQLALPYACCAARYGGEIGHLGPVANAAAELADRLGDPHDLETLHGMLDEIVQAASPRVTEATLPSEAARAWRTLILNRASVAMRTLQPALMKAAFDALVEQVPAAAPDFFREGMAQMQAPDCPAPARDLMHRYYETWCKPRQLH
jgi:hypothetical protein